MATPMETILVKIFATARLAVGAAFEIAQFAQSGVAVAGCPALFINSFEYNDPAEFERANDLVVRRPSARKNYADR